MLQFSGNTIEEILEDIFNHYTDETKKWVEYMGWEIKKKENKMRFIIHCKTDSVVVEGNTVEDCRKQKDIEVIKRGWKITDCWSEKI